MPYRTIESIIFTRLIRKTEGNAETANQGFGLAELLEAAIPLNDMSRKGRKRARVRNERLAI